MAYTDSSLWGQTLAPQPEDPDAVARARLSTAYVKMRECVAPLVDAAHRDCPGLTVHDITHLDALWETASIIVGDQYKVNPLEAFVFGAAVLLHDAGMAIASYERGLEEIKNTVEWRNAVGISLRSAGIDNDEELITSPPSNVADKATFEVLRALHAKNAETLLARMWSVSGRQPFGILDDDDLKNYYGRRIGLIAHSHNWSVEKTQRECCSHVTPMVGLPASWVLDEFKVASMLRCADAAHIDSRRAPKMAYAINSPKGLSDQHWKFQSKLGQVGRQDKQLTYSSSPFAPSEAEAWWIAFDVARMIDKEIRASNAALQENGGHQFSVDGVRGVQSPKAFALQLPVSGWEPVEAEVTVSDPVHLALTLGGRNLHRRGFHAPVREMLQNAVDAVKGRRGDKTPDGFPGKVRVVIERAAKGTLLMHFDDDGMGMPPSVLTGPLIDFGKSIWSSALLSDEYPGLSTARTRPVGKFGIGFFSVFLLGTHVTVASRRYNAGHADAKTLVFSKLSRRPLLRPSEEGELPEEFCTRVSVEISAEMMGESQENAEESYSHSRLASRVSALVVHLAATSDVNVEVRDEVNHSYHRHNWDWVSSTPETFLDELFAQRSASERAALRRGYASLIRPLTSSKGHVYGRAALLIEESGDYRRDFPTSYMSVGGVVTSKHGISDSYHREYEATVRYIGVISSKTDDASRKTVKSCVPNDVMKNWLDEQVTLIDKAKHQVMTLVKLSHRVHAWGGDPGELPFCYSGGNIVTRSEVIRRISENGEAYLLLVKNVVDSLNWLSFEGISVPLLTDRIKSQAVVCTIGNAEAFGQEFGQWLARRVPIDVDLAKIPAESAAKNPILGIATKVLGNRSKGTIEYIDTSDADLDIPAPKKLAFVIKRSTEF